MELAIIVILMQDKKRRDNIDENGIIKYYNADCLWLGS